MPALAAQAAQGQWTQGYGQGNLEYFIDAQGMRLLIGCPTQEGSADAASSVNLMEMASSQEVKKFTVKVGGHTFEGPFEADSRVGENNFIALLGGLRKGEAVVSYGGKTISPRATLPKSCQRTARRASSATWDERALALLVPVYPSFPYSDTVLVLPASSGLD